jgi:FKBP-type peptidyl-prolyl cis-trans isomerase SlyD
LIIAAQRRRQATRGVIMSELTIGADVVVGIIYTLTDEYGDEIDSNRGGQPLHYLHGHGQLVPGVEVALEGKQAGQTVAVSVEPEQGYGVVDPAKRFTVARSNFEFEVKAGDVVKAQLQDGQEMPLQVAAADDEEVTLDGNHPLAGKTLNFEIEIVEVRAATAEELSESRLAGGAAPN